jgi:CubicO group peptidase (beta-lactamase class C family)
LLSAILLSIGFFSNTQAQNNLNNSLLQIFDDENLAGLSVVGVRQNAASYVGSFGKRDIGRWLFVNDSTMFRIASVSKSVVAVGIMKLYESGLLNVYNDVNRYLNFSLRNPSFPNDSITIKMLLNHTSSLQDGSSYSNFLAVTGVQNPPPALSGLLVPGGVFYSPSMFRPQKPGTYFNYSNIEFGVLATIIEKVTGIRFDIWIRSNILLPLNIKGSFNIQDISDINNVAVLYRYEGGHWVPQADNYQGVMPEARDLSNYIIGSNGLVFSPAGGLRISGPDLSRFMLMYMNNGLYNGMRILNDSTCRLLRTPQWTYLGPLTGNNYYGLFCEWGMGIQITTNTENGDIVFPGGHPMFGHAGEAYGLVSDMFCDTLSQSGVVLIVNGKQGEYETAVGSAFYSVEKSVFDAVYDWSLELPVSLDKHVFSFPDCVIQPNPTNGNCVLTLPEFKEGLITIVDASGCVQQRLCAVPGENDIDLSNLRPGIYFLYFIENDGSILRKKIVVTR